MNDTLARFTVQERATGAYDTPAGIARRWDVLDEATGAKEVVAVTKQSPGNFASPPSWLCSCRAITYCVHRAAVRATLPPDDPPAAA